MKLEEAISRDRIIGWRVTAGSDVALVWMNQQSMPGLRMGNAFVPSIGEVITYRTTYEASENNHE